MFDEAPRGRNVWLSRALTALGLACLIFYALATLQTTVYQRKATVEAVRQVPVERPPAKGELIGRVEVPRLKLSAAVAEGDDDATLGKAVGHLPDTPLPWLRHGNVGFAAHRDGLFRRLEKIKLNDEVKFIGPRGEYLYRVRRTHIVDPDDIWVLAPSLRPTLTLITCYPFSFVGNAPHRFVVQAELVGGVEGAVLEGAVLQ